MIKSIIIIYTIGKTKMKVLLTLAALSVTAFAEVVTLDLTQYPQIRYD